VRRALAEAGIPRRGDTLVVGLSGGPDSVSLLDALVSLSQNRAFALVAAHFDHQLRPASREDAAFCAQVCERLGVRLRSGSSDVRGRAGRDGGGIEEAGRIERYRFLRAVRREEGAVAIAVAHTRDDQAETVLLRLLRGAGRVGLSAMGLRSEDILRPLLRVSREQVIEHLTRGELAWRSDPTNTDSAFLRNRVRKELIPLLESRFNPRIREALSRLAGLLADEAELLDGLGNELLGRIARKDEQGVSLSRRGLVSGPRAVARLAIRGALEQNGGLRGITSAHVERILDIAHSKAPSGRALCLPGNRGAHFRFGEVYIGRRSTPGRPFLFPLRVPGEVKVPGGVVVARLSEGPAECNGQMAVVPADPVAPLVVRTRQPGDRVRTEKREVSLRRFLMDRKVPADLRASLPIVASGHKVLWIPGQPLGNGSPACRSFVRLEWMPTV